jgi:prepilin-type processing-associated H-X9-DG protein
MYKIIGTDQKEYGPVSAQQISQWISQGRLNAQSKAQLEGGEWKPLAQFPEFTSIFAPPTVAPSSVIPPVATPARTSGMAIASLVLGILGMFSCGVTALVGLILGFVAMGKVKRSNGTITGHGIALAGTIVSAIFLLFTVPMGAAIFLPALAKAKARAQSVQCMNNVHRLDIAIQSYAAEHDGQFPYATNWCDAIESKTSSPAFKCPAAGANDRCDYAFNSRVSGMNRADINGQTVVLFETDDQWNANGGPELMPAKWRHHNTCIVAFADGHAEVVSVQRISQLRWNP